MLYVVQSLSRVWLFVTPWTAARQASLSFTFSQSCSNSRPLSQWCHPTISSSLVLFSSCPQSFSASGSFPVSQLFTASGQSIWCSVSVDYWVVIVIIVVIYPTLGFQVDKLHCWELPDRLPSGMIPLRQSLPAWKATKLNRKILNSSKTKAQWWFSMRRKGKILVTAMRGPFPRAVSPCWAGSSFFMPI